MSETVKAMCHYALQQKGVKHIIAETEYDGLASQGILQRCGFKGWNDLVKIRFLNKKTLSIKSKIFH